MKLFFSCCSPLVCVRREFYPSNYTGGKAVLQLSLARNPSFHRLCMLPCHHQTKEGTSGAGWGLGAPRGRPPLDCLRSPPPSHGVLLVGLGACSHGAFGSIVSGTCSLLLLLLFGLNHVSVALGLTLVYFHVGHLQTNIPPKLVEMIS